MSSPAEQQRLRVLGPTGLMWEQMAELVWRCACGAMFDVADDLDAHFLACACSPVRQLTDSLCGPSACEGQHE